MAQTIGEKIRAVRKERGLTQKELGERAGIAEPTIRRYELGKLNPKLETVKKIAAALDAGLSDFYGETKKDSFDFLLLTDLLKGTERLSKNPFIESSGKQVNELMMYFCCLNQEGRDKAVERIQELTEIDRYKDKDTMKKLETLGVGKAEYAARDAAGAEPDGTDTEK